MADNFRANIRNPWVLTRSFVISLAFVLTVQACYQLYDAALQRYAYDNYQPARDGRAPIMIKGQPKPHSYEPNCKQPQNREDADLCAQWSAVTQGTEANRLASLSLQLSIGTLIATIFGTGLLVWTLQETRQTARRELRAYVSVEMAGLEFTLADGKAIAHIKLKNGGQTPAYLCRHSGNVFIATDDEAERDIVQRPKKYIGEAKPFTLHMNDPQGGTIYAHEPITLEALREVVEGDKWLYVYCTVFYQDTFDINRETRMCIKTDDLNLPDAHDPAKWPRKRPQPTRGDWIMAGFHNEST